MPESFVIQVIQHWGEAGRHWLETLPAMLAGLQAKLQLHELEPAGNLGLHWVGHGFLHGDTQQVPVTLKLGLPDAEFEISARALIRGQNHPHMVRLLQAQPEAGWLLMERILPGRQLSELPDEEALEVWLSELCLLAASPDDHRRFPDARRWCQALWQAPAKTLPSALLFTARSLCLELLVNEPVSLLLHGDLHHQNLLQNAQGGWIVIDPKGVLAGPEFELGAMLRNPFPSLSQDPDRARRLQARLTRISRDSRFDIDRVLKWALVQAVLAACWCQTQSQMLLWLKVAETLAELA